MVVRFWIPLCQIRKRFMGSINSRRATPLLNILGMTIAFAAFYVIMSQVMFDSTYNYSIRDSKRIYMIVSSLSGGDNWISRCPAQASVRAADAIPGADIGFCSLMEYGDDIWTGEGNDRQKFKFGVYVMDPECAEILGMKFVSGSFPSNEGGVAISEKAAMAMSVEPGDMVFLSCLGDGPMTSAVVSGIFAPYASNSDFADFDIVVNDRETIRATENNNYNYNGIVSLRNHDDTAMYEDLLNRYIFEWNKERYISMGYGDYDDDFIMAHIPRCRLIPLSRLHMSGVDMAVSGGRPCVARSSVLTLLGIALLIIIIAYINFINFFVALVPEKMRSVNVRKVFGASRGRLVAGFIREALMYVGISIVLACVVILVLTKSPVNGYVSGGLAIGMNALAFVALIIVSVLFAVLSAFFPAMYVTKVNAAFGVRSGYSGSLAGRVLRKVLVTVQLVAAVSMMIIALVFNMQYRYMVHQKVVFDTGNLFTMSVHGAVSPGLRSRVEDVTGVTGVTASSDQVTGDPGSRYFLPLGDDEEVTLKVRRVMPNYLDVIGIPLLSGEGFTSSGNNDMIMDVKISEVLSSEMDEKLSGSGINFKGVAASANTAPLTDRSESSYDVYENCGYYYPYYWLLIFRIDETADIRNVLAQVKAAAMDEMRLDEEPDIFTVDDEVRSRYMYFSRQSVIVALFSLTAIVIALMGLFGIMLFETGQRRRETAIRKVLGADSRSIVGLFCRQYMWTVIVACIVSIPVARLVTGRWLQQFSAAVTISPVVYVCTFMLVALLVFGLVAIRTMRAASENPVENLKSE